MAITLEKINPQHKVLKVDDKYFFKFPGCLQYMLCDVNGNILDKKFRIYTPKHIQGYASVSNTKIKGYKDVQKFLKLKK